jgi:hypothetical protein
MPARAADMKATFAVSFLVLSLVAAGPASASIGAGKITYNVFSITKKQSPPPSALVSGR